MLRCLQRIFVPPSSSRPHFMGPCSAGKTQVAEIRSVTCQRKWGAMSDIVESPKVSPGPRHWLRRGVAIAGFALMSGALPLAVLASPSSTPTNLAECGIGWVWDPIAFRCVPVAPVVGPVGPVGVGGVVGPVGVNPVLGPVGPVGVGGVVGPVGVDPILGPVGPVGVGHR